MDTRRYHLKFGILYIFTIGVILLVVDIIAPFLFTTTLLGRINDIVLIIITPIVAMVLINRIAREMEYTYPSKKIEKIIKNVKNLSGTPYAKDNFNQQKSKIVSQLKELKKISIQNSNDTKSDRINEPRGSKESNNSK